MSQNPNQQRISDLIRTLDAVIRMDLPYTDDRDINEILGEYDGRLLSILELWDELLLLLGQAGLSNTGDKLQ